MEGEINIQCPDLVQANGMRIGGVTGASGESGGRPQGAGVAATEPRVESRALTVVTPEPPRDVPNVYRQAAFLAQLIATKDQHAQTRSRRRAAPEEAIAAYRAVAKLTARQ
jgi:hypothetical protein